MCNGAWKTAALELLQFHTLATGRDMAKSAADALWRALVDGAKKGAVACFVGPKDSGKTFLTSPVEIVFKDHVFLRTAGRSNFPLQDLPGKKVVCLQDFRVDSCGLSWDDLLAWWEGSPLKVGMPRNVVSQDVLQVRLALAGVELKSSTRLQCARK